jgi:hypothetical protein
VSGRPLILFRQVEIAESGVRVFVKEEFQLHTISVGKPAGEALVLYGMIFADVIGMAGGWCGLGHGDDLILAAPGSFPAGPALSK